MDFANDVYEWEKFVHISPDGRYRYGIQRDDQNTKRRQTDTREDEYTLSEDLFISSAIDTMPVGQSPAQTSSRSTDKKFQRNQNQKKNGAIDNKQIERKRGRSPFNPLLRKPKQNTPKATEITNGSKREKETLNAEDKTLKLISDNLSEYSRQRMRALQMSFRHYSNVEGRISMKELNLACQENSIQLSNRVTQILQQKFEDHQGIDIEKLFKYLAEAHSRSGRDSVMAMHLRNDLEPKLETNQEEKDADLLRRLEDLLVKDNTFFDIDALRISFSAKDKQKSGKVASDEIFDIIALKQQPIYGSLLKALVKRCDMDKDGVVSWPEFLSFLEKSQKNAWTKYPEMASLPEQMKSKTPVAPEASDILSEQTKSKLVSKLLLKKASIKKKEPPVSDEKKNKEVDLPQTIHEKKQDNQDNDQNENNSCEKDNNNTIEEEPKQKEKEKTDKQDQMKHKKPPLEKTKSGFLCSVKSLLSGKKKDDVENKDSQSLKATDSSADISKTQSQEVSPREINLDDSKETEDMTKDEPTTAQNPPVFTIASTNDDIEEKNQTSADTIKEEEKDTGSKTGEDDTNKTIVQEDTATRVPIKDTVGKLGTKETGSNDNIKDDVTNGGEQKDAKISKTEEKVTEDVVKEQKVEKVIPKDSGGPKGNLLTLTRNGKTTTFPKPPDYDSQQVKLEPPEARLKLDWVYGYRGIDCRNNIHVLPSDEIVYFISNIVVIYDREAHKQRHYREHTEYIKCIALHSNGVTVATGQVYSKHRPKHKPHIRIWRADTLQTVHILDQFEKSVMCLSFSRNQDILAAIENTLDKKLSVWNSTSGEFITQTEVETELICDVSFNPKYPDLLVTSGKEHLQWWKIYEESKTLQAVAKPLYENNLRAKYIIFLAHNDKGDLVTGDSNGTIYIWADGGNKITNFVKHAHDGPVFVVMCYKNFVISGGRDGVVHCWICNKNMDNVGELQIPRSEGGIRMLQLHGESLIIGTTMNSMLSTQLSSKGPSPMHGCQLDPVPFTQGHYDDLRGLSVMHESQLGGDFLTAGNDGVVCWFNTVRRDPVCKLMLKGMQFTCADSSYDGSNVVLGTKNGHLVILNIEGEASSEVFNNKITKERIECVRFSPDYTMIAVACHDCAIHLYKLVPKNDGTFQWELKGKCMGHNEPVVDVDFSADLYSDHFLLRGCSNIPETLYWNSQTMDLIDFKDCQNVPWMTEKCKMTPLNIGLWWSKLQQDGEINCVDVYSETGLIVSGDSCGNVCLYRYPCNRKGMFCHMYHGHTAVHNVSFSRDGHYVVSVGGRDSCIIQWKIV